MSRLHGFDETIRAFQNWQRGPLGSVVRGLIEGYTFYVYQRSQELVPVSDPDGSRSFDFVVGAQVPSGHLKGSARWSVSYSADGLVATGRVSYNASYAVFVHEVEAEHPHHGQWKYLETAAKEFLTVAQGARLNDIVTGSTVGLRSERGAFGPGGEFVPPPEGR